MTPNEFYEKLQSAKESDIVTLSPGPLKIRVGQSDAMAAKLILWLQDEMPEDATISDLFDVLAAATWWATFWSSLEKESGASADSELDLELLERAARACEDAGWPANEDAAALRDLAARVRGVQEIQQG